MTETLHEEHHVGHHEEIKSAPNEIEQLKTEILNTLQNKKEKMRLPWGSLSVTIVLGVLAVLSVVQTIQSAVLLSKIKGGNLNADIAASTSLDEAPDMVGGC